MPGPDPHVTPRRPRIKVGDVQTDADGQAWRIVDNRSNGLSRVRVGSLAEEVIFGPAPLDPGPPTA
jgi:hypothetical protein